VGAGPAARIHRPGPNATNGATRATRREAWVTDFDCGAGGALHRPTALMVSSQLDHARGLALCLPRDPNRGTKGFEAMTRTAATPRTAPNSAALRRGELIRDRGLRRLSLAIDARRHLNTRPTNPIRAEGDPRGPSDPRHAYLTQSHD
jgi:hypothetical protein